MLDKLAGFAEQPTVSPLYVQNGNSAWAQHYAEDLKDVVLRYADRLPRNVQRHLGPSELGFTCDRQVVGKMAGVSFHAAGAIRNSYAWASIVGTAIHAFLEQAFQWDAQQGANPGRWLPETRVTPDPGAPQPHPGTADLFDTLYFSVDDHKGLALDTRIPTPTGWTTMGALKTGDPVIGADGKPCRVTRVYPVQQRSCYRVTFKGGAAVVTDDVQLWEVQRNKDGGYGRKRETVLLSSVQVAAQLKAVDGQRHLRVRTVASEFPEATLPVHPYVLGLWLGDGDRYGGQIGAGREDATEMFANIRACGYETGKLLSEREGGFEKRTVLGLLPQLQAVGCVIRVKDSSRAKGQGYLGEKVIPAAYMRSSRGQRLELMRGLMDSDGTHNRVRNQCVFSSAEKELAYQVEELAASLGWKSYTCPVKKQGFGKVYDEPAYQVMFNPAGENPFRLKRKAELVRPKTVAGSDYRLVQSVDPVPSVPTRCIDVDSPDHLYLVTEQFIPTHNCQSEAIRARLRRDGPPLHYFLQLLFYAIGYMHKGYDVRRVVLISWPRTRSTLDDMFVWEHVITNEDLELAVSYLEKTRAREELAKFMAEGGVSFWEVPPTPSPEDCEFCPFSNPAALQDGTSQGCPGMSLLKSRRR